MLAVLPLLAILSGLALLPLLPLLSGLPLLSVPALLALLPTLTLTSLLAFAQTLVERVDAARKLAGLVQRLIHRVSLRRTAERGSSLRQRVAQRVEIGSD